MQFNPLNKIMTLYSSEPETRPQAESDTTKAGKFTEEASFFIAFFKKQVRPEDIAPFLWRRLYKEDEKKRRQELRRVNKKKGVPGLLLRKRDHEPDSHEKQAKEYV
ncbi:hypothetical protein [Endozoicomonas sp. Mp262]|uniref:hypothetical protein n=1 Tax=Endozoicomonas sp. Mp262 TaxID=2919499 RepID=UPI0021E0BD9B